ncbi:MAG: glycosyltransferase family 4 protein [Candidatus Omnitrophica bacterium]|nr:glycosyltransferase family 4 protein [Candidatus Omnitrophota bacterium]
MKKRLKVLHVITRLDKGGSSENTLLTASGLDKGRFDVTLVFGKTNDPDGRVRRALSDNGINYRVVPRLVRQVAPWSDLIAFLKLCAIIKKGNFDIVHTHTSKAGILGRWAAKLAGVKAIIHTPHGHIFYGYFGPARNRLFIILERLTARITDRIITLTQRGKDEHVRFRISKADKFVPIYSGVELEKFIDSNYDPARTRESLGIPPNGPVIGTITRLEPVKGNMYFIEAIPQVIRIFPDLKVIITGDGAQRRAIENRIKELSLSRNIILRGATNDAPRALSALDIFVLASLNEGMGRCLLEAMALSIPIIATDVGGVSEIVENGVNGILVPSKDAAALAQAIISLLRDKARAKEMGKAGKNKLNRFFSAKAMVEKIEALYEELI